MEKMQQVYKRTEMDNEGRTVIHWCLGQMLNVRGWNISTSVQANQ